MWRFSMVLVAACTEHGSGGGTPFPPDANPNARETSPFIPQLCTGGVPGTGNPSCPTNTVDLGGFVPGAAISFVVHVLGPSEQVQDVTLSASGGDYEVIHPAFLTLPSGTGNPITHGDPFADVAVQVLPGSPVVLEGVVDLGLSEPSDRMIVRFDEIAQFDF